MSSETRAKVEDEVRLLLMDAYERAKAILHQHEAELHKLAKELLDKETLSGELIMGLLGAVALPNPPKAAPSPPAL